jgi:hypothetical protein
MINYFSHCPSEDAIAFNEKRGNCENYIMETKYDIAVGYLLLMAVWANEAVFQLTMSACNLFSLLKIDFV